MRFNRSPQEIASRLAQGFHNLRLWALPPQTGLGGPMPRELPDLHGTAFAESTLEIANNVLAGRYPLFGDLFDLGPEPDWRKDFVHSRRSSLKYFRLVPYLDFDAVGDHKVVWELNRHQWLVPLAMAWRLTGDERYRQAISRALESWIRENPFQTGINWCSALEVGVRSLSWIWTWLLAGVGEPAALYQHGLHLERNLSFYFSPNTHLLGEAVALHALGVVFPDWPRAKQWRELGGRVAREQIDRQVQPDGSHFEQSSYYHVYTLDMFLLHRSFGGDVPDDRLAAMAEYLHALLGPRRAIPLIGDDDGGRLFHPYGPGVRFGRSTLATCAVLLGRTDWPYDAEDLHDQAAWWFGPGFLRNEANPGRVAPPRRFCDSGLVVLARGDLQVLFDAGPFGRGSGGHSHADTLSVIASRGQREILVDSGTYTYITDPAARTRFRGTAAHNTVGVDGQDQAKPAGPFRWDDAPVVELLKADDTSAEAVCRTLRYTHRRRIVLLDDQLHVDDAIEGGEVVDQYWHLGPEIDARIVGSAGSTVQQGERSLVYGHKFDSAVVRVSRRGTPAQITTVIDLKGRGD